MNAKMISPTMTGAQKTDSPGRAPVPPSLMTAEERARTVLVVEDDQDIREQLRAVALSLGLLAVCAEDGVQALRFLEKGAPGALLLDLGLPKVNGFQVLDALSHHPRGGEVAVAVTSGVFMEKEEVLPFLARFKQARFIPKPFSVTSLMLWVAGQLQTTKTPAPSPAIPPPVRGPNRRKETRTSLNLLATISISGKDRQVRIRDATAVGLRLHVDRGWVRKEERVRIRIPLPGSEGVRFLALAQWVRPATGIPGTDEVGLLLEVTAAGGGAWTAWLATQTKPTVDDDGDHWI